MAALKRICTDTTSGTSTHTKTVYINVQRCNRKLDLLYKEEDGFELPIGILSKSKRNPNNDEVLMESEWLWLLMSNDLLNSSPSCLRRFHNSLTDNKSWIRERSHESYAKNYSVVFPFDEPLASRNMRKDPFHQVDVRFYIQCRQFNKMFLEELKETSLTSCVSAVS